MSRDEHTYLQKTNEKDGKGEAVQTSFKTSTGSYSSFYSDYVSCLKEFCESRFITPGLNMCERQAVIVDFDIRFEDELLQLFLEQCAGYGLAFPNYLIVNTERKANMRDMFHFQIGWLFDRPLITSDTHWSGSSESRNYRDLIYILSSLFTLGGEQYMGDTNFTGSRIRNPYCNHNQRVTWFDEKSRVNLTTFLNRIKELDSEMMILKKKREQKSASRSENKNSNSKDRTSRNCAGLANACAFIRKYKILNNNEWPPLELVTKAVEEAEWQVATLYPEKGGIEDSETIKKLAIAALNYMHAHYRYIPTGNEKRALGLYVRSAKKAYNVVYVHLLKHRGILQKDIAQKMEMDKGSISRLANDETSLEIYTQQLRDFVRRDIKTEKAQNLKTEIIELFNLMEGENAI